MPTPDQKPPERGAGASHRAILDALEADMRQADDRAVLRELINVRAEIAELRRALLPSTSGLILGADAAAEFRRITRNHNQGGAQCLKR